MRAVGSVNTPIPLPPPGSCVSIVMMGSGTKVKRGRRIKHRKSENKRRNQKGRKKKKSGKRKRDGREKEKRVFQGEYDHLFELPLVDFPSLWMYR